MRSVDELLAYFRGGGRADGQQLIGLEHEKLRSTRRGHDAGALRGRHRDGADRFGRFGWKEYREAPGLPVIAMTRGHGDALARAGRAVRALGHARLATAREAHDENLQHLAELTRRCAAASGCARWRWATGRSNRRRRHAVDAEDPLPGDARDAGRARHAGARHDADDGDRAGVARLGRRGRLRAQGDRSRRGCRRCWSRSTRTARWSRASRRATCRCAAGCGPTSTRRAAATCRRCSTARSRTARTSSGRSTRRCCSCAATGEYLTPKLTFRQLLAEGFEGQPALYDGLGRSPVDALPRGAHQEGDRDSLAPTATAPR